MVLAMSLLNFKTVFPIRKEQRIRSYFKPRCVLKGRNICCLEFSDQAIQDQRDAVELDLLEKHGLYAVDFFANSLAFYMFIDPSFLQESMLQLKG